MPYTARDTEGHDQENRFAGPHMLRSSDDCQRDVIQCHENISSSPLQAEVISVVHLYNLFTTYLHITDISIRFESAFEQASTFLGKLSTILSFIPDPVYIPIQL